MKKLLLLLLLGTAHAQVTLIARMLSGINVQNGTSYIVQTVDSTRITVFSNAAPIAVTMSAGNTLGFTAGYEFSFRNNGAGTATITCSGCTINGAGSLALTTSQGVDLYSDGLNYTGQTYGTGGGGGGGLSGMTAGQVPIAATASTVTSSKPIQGTDASLLSSGTIAGGAGTALCIDANSGATTTGCTAPFSTITAGTNTAALVVGSTGALTPATDGEIAASNFWSVQGLPAATAIVNNSGGNIQNNHTVTVVYTLVTARGETVPSVETKVSIGAGCTGGNQCQVVVTAPTASCGALPCGPYTGYTVYSIDQGAFLSGQELKQTASNACVNITTNCTINTGGAGAAFSNTPTAFVNPVNLQPSTSGVTMGLNPSWYVTDWNTGNSFIQGGMIGATNVNFNTSTFTEIRRHWFNDTGLVQNGTNAQISVNHLSGSFTSTANQDRAIWVSHATVSGSTSNQYSLTGVQSEVDVLATGAGFGINGSPDGEIAAFSGQVGDSATQNYAASGFGANVARFTYFKSGAGSVGGSSDTYNVINGSFSVGNSTFSAGAQATILNASCANGVSGVINNLGCWGMKFKYPTTANRFGNGSAALYVPSAPLTPVALSDFLIRVDNPGLGLWGNGPAEFSSVQMNNVALMNLYGSVAFNGSITGVSTTAPNINTATCSGGASQYTYQLIGIDNNGGAAPGSTLNTASSCVNPLTVGNPVTVATSATQQTEAEYVRIDVYRTAGPMGTGKIGSMNCVTGAATTAYCGNFLDTGLAADGGTPPTVNTTGGLGTGTTGISHLKGNLVQVASNFTTAANTNLQTITGLVFNLPSVAANYSFHCSGSYSQATGTAAVSFGIQSATVAPTNIFVNGQIFTAAGTVTTGTQATITNTTATAVVSGTPAAIATNNNWQLDGTMEEPANDQGNVINIMVSTATSGDAVTVLRGSYCSLY
jgi:hypothetical protein